MMESKDIDFLFDDALKYCLQTSPWTEDKKNWVFNHPRKPHVMTNVYEQVAKTKAHPSFAMRDFHGQKELIHQTIGLTAALYVRTMDGMYRDLAKTQAQKQLEASEDAVTEEMKDVLKEVDDGRGTTDQV